MRKFFVLFCFCLLPFSLKADCTWLEFKASYYHFDSEHVRDILGSGTALYQGEINYAVLDDIVLFADAGYMTKNGRSLNFHQRTRLEAVPFSFGVKYNQSLGYGSVYFGGGVRVFAVQIENRSNAVEPHIRQISTGGVLCTGLNFCYKNFIFNPFFEYSFMKFFFDRNGEDIARNIYRHDLKLTGYSIGAGIGYLY